MASRLRRLIDWARFVRDIVERPALVRFSVALCFGSLVFFSARFHHSSHGAVDDPVRMLVGAVVMVGLLWTLRRVVEPGRYARRALLAARRLPALVAATAGVLVMVRCTSMALAALARPGSPIAWDVALPAAIAVVAVLLVNAIVVWMRAATVARHA